ncbi:MAG: N-acetylmuramoyl-L-alanine amidase, partial [Bilophila sp.]
HPASVLVDDALYNAARLKAEYLSDLPGAQALLQKIKQLPTADRAQAAASYAKALASGAPPVPAPGKAPSAPTSPAAASVQTTATLTQIAWQTRRNTVTITLEFDRAVVWTVLSQPANKKTGSPIRLVVDIADAAPDSKIRPGVKIAESDLRRLRIDLSSPGHTRLLLDFSALKRFRVSTEEKPFRLIITAASTDAALPKGARLGQTLQSDEPIQPTLPSSLARQLGLTVGTVILDPGHGGKDSGTSHNNVIESETTLDLTRRVGALLAANGLRVLHTRTNDSWVSLEARSRKANEIKADLMVSIHVNASPNTATTGFETYYLNFASNTDAVKLAGVENAMSDRKLGELEGILADLMLSARTQESRRMAENIQKATLSRLKKKDYDTRDGGIKSAPFHVLIGSGMPGVLIEVGYCTNQQEARRLTTPAYRAALAEGIANGILAYTG